MLKEVEWNMVEGMLPKSQWEKRLLTRRASGTLEVRLRRQLVAIVVGSVIGLAAVAVGVLEFVANIEDRSPFIRFVASLIVVIFGIYMLYGSIQGLSIRRRLLRGQVEGVMTDEPDNEGLLAQIRGRDQNLK